MNERGSSFAPASLPDALWALAVVALALLIAHGCNVYAGFVEERPDDGTGQVETWEVAIDE